MNIGLQILFVTQSIGILDYSNWQQKGCQSYLSKDKFPSDMRGIASFLYFFFNLV